MLQNEYIQLIPADILLAEKVTDYYQRNRLFLENFEPERSDEFFSLEYQKRILKKQMTEFKEKVSANFYLTPRSYSKEIIGSIGLSSIAYGSFCSAYLGYKLDKDFINRGFMTMAVEMIVEYAFKELKLHRIEANVMPKNKASLKVLEKCKFINEGMSKYYLNIHGSWEDHIHMVRINYAMHERIGLSENLL